MADAIRDEAGKLPYKASTIRQIQDSMGIAAFRDTVYSSDTLIDFEGYFAESGFPIQYFVREVEKGTSVIPAHAFQRTAYNRVRAEAEAAGEKEAEAFAQRVLDKIQDK